jgi:hypothetical protein
MSSSVVGTHFKVDLRSNGVALVTLDTPDSKVNVLNKVRYGPPPAMAIYAHQHVSTLAARRWLHAQLLCQALMVDFEALIKRIETDSDIKSVVVLSGKSDTWIAGADIKMLDACSSEEEYRTLIKDGHRLFNALANSPKPVSPPDQVASACRGPQLIGGRSLLRSTALASAVDWRQHWPATTASPHRARSAELHFLCKRVRVCALVGAVRACVRV